MKKQSIQAPIDVYSYSEVSKRHAEHLKTLANIHAQIREMRDDFKDVSEHYGDAGDTWMDADQVLLDLGSLLADLTVYVSEYREEADNGK